MDTLQVIIYILLPTVFGLIALHTKSITNRLDVLETKIQDKTSHDDVRLLLADNLNPIREDIKEVKALSQALMNKLIDIQLSRPDPR